MQGMPGGVAMPCDQNPDALHTYLDGELPAEKQLAVQQHLRTCASCATEIAELVSMRRSLIPARSRYMPSSEFRRKIQQQSTVAEKPSALRRFALWMIPLAVMVLLTVAVVQRSLRSDAFGEVADMHINALASSNPLDVISTDRHTVKPWFQGKLPFSFNVPELAGGDFTLLGGKLAYLHQQPGAELIIAMKQHKISVLIFQESAVLDTAFPISSKVGNHNAFSIGTWRSQGLRFFIIGDADPMQMNRLEELFQRVNQ
jgi:anti-sigma factor RsiW